MTAAEKSDGDSQARRRAAMAVLAGCAAADIADHLGAIAVPAYRELRAPEQALVMLRGRIGGDGAPFNLGEATVTRAVVELPTGERGFAHILGRDGETARLAAIADALWLRRASRGDVETMILAPIEARLAAEAAKTRAETAATRVDFFTLVRGEDAA